MRSAVVNNTSGLRDPFTACPGYTLVVRSQVAKPYISVLMAVYNDAPYLREAIKSILRQDAPPFEFVIVDDAGTDGSSEILQSYKDARITLIRNHGNKGLAASLNLGLSYCRAPFIARQDGDDISENERLRVQIDYLLTHSEIAYTGSGVILIDDAGKAGTSRLYPEAHDEIARCFASGTNPLPHSTLFFRREALEEIGGYDERFRKAEDHDLHLRLIRRHRAASVQRLLVRIRTRPHSMQWSDSNGDCLKHVLYAHAKNYAELKFGGLNASEEGAVFHEIARWVDSTGLSCLWAASLERGRVRELVAKEAYLKAIHLSAHAVLLDPRWLLTRLRGKDYPLLTKRRLSTLHTKVKMVVGGFRSSLT